MDQQRMTTLLDSLDGKGYGAYKRLKGEWSFPRFSLFVDYVQGDPYAAPSRLRAMIPPEVAALPADLFRTRPRAIGTASFMARRFADRAVDLSAGTGSGNSGRIRIEAPGQAVFETTALQLHPDGGVEIRFGVGLPAGGRRIRARAAIELLTERVPRAIDESGLSTAYELAELRLHAETNEDADALRDQLRDHRWVGFVADGSILPRRSGIDDRPLDTGDAVPFESPPALRAELDTPNRGRVSGMAIPRGVTLIAGGGYHGKSTLLRAIATGVHNHRPGDGRERVVTDPAAVKVRAEDGRSVAGVDISPFIGPLPGGADTTALSTPNASGSTSQAAAIAEALEVGATALLIDEDTAATNLMIRDRRMQALVPRDSEPITPLIDHVRGLTERLDVSVILVIGGSGDYLEVADTVIGMRHFRAADWSLRAREVVESHPTGRVPESSGPLSRPAARLPHARSIDPSRGRRSVRIRCRETDAIEFGETTIDLRGVDPLPARSQTRAIGLALVLVRDHLEQGATSLPEALDRVEAAIRTDGLDTLSDRRPGDLSAFRRFELAAALNRLRTLEVRASREDS